MNYLFANTGLWMLLAALIGFVSATVSGWILYRGVRARQAVQHGLDLASFRSDLEASEVARSQSDAAAEELRGVAEADAARLRAMEARLRNQEDCTKADLEKKVIELASARAELAAASAASVRQESKAVAHLSARLAELQATKESLEAQATEQRQTVELSKQQEAEARKAAHRLEESQGVIALLREEAASALSQKQAAENQAREIEKEFRNVMAMREEEFRAMQLQTVVAVEAQQRFETEVSAARAALEARDAQIARLASELSASQAGFSGLQADSGLVPQLRQGIEERQTQIEVLQAQLSQTQEEIQNLRSALTGRNETMSRLEADAGLLSHVRQGMRERQTRIDGLQLQLKASKKEIADLQGQLTGRNETMSRLEADAALLSHVRQGMRQRQTQIEGLRLQLEQAKHVLAESANTSFSKTSTPPPAVSAPRIGELESELEVLRTEMIEAVSAKDRQLQLLESNLMSASGTVATEPQQDAKIAELESELFKLRAEMAAAKAAVAQVNHGDQRIAELESELESSRTEMVEAVSTRDRQIQLLESNLVAASSSLSDGEFTPASKASAERLNALQSEIAVLRTELADREERIEAWESRYETAIGQMHADAGLARMQASSIATESRPLAFAAAAGAGAGPMPSQTSTAAPLLPPEPTLAERLDLQARLRLASLRGIQFLPDSDELLPESGSTLREAREALQQLDENHRVEIGGHTDSWGDTAHNRELSLRRAKAVRRYLVQHGANGTLLIAAGYGDTRPIANNDDPDGRFANRRIEFQVRGPVR